MWAEPAIIVKQQNIVPVEEVSGIIEIMPVSLSNKIAAGEVVQRPASAVKELVENALDAGAENISLILQRAGSELIQVVDDGSGMSVIDARLCFERHATSKIRRIEDLESIHTLGFRGEALASIAAVSQIELKTGRVEDESAICIRIEGGEVIEESVIAPMQGTSVSVKNLFFNVPARRNFLKRPQTELKHILDIIQVLALSHPEVGFSVEHDGNTLLSVSPRIGMPPNDALRERASDLTPLSPDASLIPVDESTSYLSVRGILGSPDGARRTRGLQFLFVNGRYVKHRYIEHAVLSSYEYLLSEGAFPFFALFLDIDPRHVDVNVHPTKAEVKFDDERGVYGMLRAVTGRALGMALQTPDLSQATPLQGLNLDIGDAPMEQKSKPSNAAAYFVDQGGTWVSDASRALYKGLEMAVPAARLDGDEAGKSGVGEEGLLWQLHDAYILTQIRSGLVIIEQQAAHERILYEQALSCLQDGFGLTQQLLFPRQIEFSAADYALLEVLLPDLRRLGFDIEIRKGNSVSVKGVPADIATGDEHSVLDEIVDQYRLFERIEGLSGPDNLARSTARRGAVRAGNRLSPKEMRALIDQLFECDFPYVSPDGRPTMITLSGEELRERFEKK